MTLKTTPWIDTDGGMHVVCILQQGVDAGNGQVLFNGGGHTGSDMQPVCMLHDDRISPCTARFFYRAMHFSAKRGIAIACRLSVRLSVCLSVRL